MFQKAYRFFELPEKTLDDLKIFKMLCNASKKTLKCLKTL
jgi:hypothetical protein